MRAPTDLHPADRANRDQLASQLRQIRVNLGISGAHLGTMLGYTHKSSVGAMERRRSWEIRTLQAWARALHHQFTLTITGLAVPRDGDPLNAIYANQQPSAPAAIDRLLLRRTVNDLARIRRSRMSAERLASLIGCTEEVVCWSESNPDGARLASVQRVARALGGALVPGLAPVRALAEVA